MSHQRPKSRMAAALVGAWAAAIVHAEMLRTFNRAAMRSVREETEALRRMGRRGRTTWQKPHQGKREIARRKRQIEAGILTESNGLVRGDAK
jgi:hypothetical protein